MSKSSAYACLSFVNLGTPPQELGWLKRRKLHLMHYPSWALTEGISSLQWFLDSSSELKKHGIVIAGTFVQANELLYSPGEMDCPAELLFSLDPQVSFEHLFETAERLFDLKGAPSQDAEEAFFSEHLASEVKRAQGIKIPASLNPPAESYISSAIVYRCHLPEETLKKAIYPILVSPQSLTAMILPFELWTEEGWDVYQATSW